ncbi:MAG TPA: Rieske (2Fe-2S) protein [Acidobacteriaceae bacterium]|nr:Rieske (2Fe-2S) protein [Acidobacteriaceae bacterium]
MSEWVRLCSVNDVPKTGEVMELEAGGTALCLANVEGTLHVLDNVCPHRQGPLGQGWVEGNAVICPWHAWAFDVGSGLAEEPERAQVRVFPVRNEAGEIQVNLS